MSLSNDMLKNLEARRESSQMASDITAGLLPMAVFKQQRFWLVLSVVLSSVFILLSIILLLKMPIFHRDSSIHTTSTVILPKALPPALAQQKAIAPDGLMAEKPPLNLMLKINDKAMSASKDETSIKTESPLSIEEEVEEHYQVALDFVSQNKFLEAIQLLEKIIDVAPDADPARITLATLLLDRDQYARAEALLKTGLSLQPNNTEMTALYARALLGENHPESALQILLKNSHAVVNNHEYTALLALSYQRLRHFSEAFDLYDKLSTEEPGNPRWAVGGAIALEQMGDRNRALQLYEKARANRQLSPELLDFVLGRMHVIKGDA